jgi:hypothetical protein
MEDNNFDPLSVSNNRFMDPEVYTNPKDILQQLLESKQKGTTIGIMTPILGRLIVMAGVQDLIFYDSPIVLLKPYDARGAMLAETKIPLDAIESVQPFTSRFENPFITRLSDGQGPMSYELI